MSTQAWVVLAIAALAVLALLGLAWSGARERKAKERAAEDLLAGYWDGVAADWDPITRTYAHGDAELDRVHVINREQHTVVPWPERQTPDSFDQIRDNPWTPRLPGRTTPRYATAGRHAAPEPLRWQAMPEYGEGRGEMVVGDFPVSPAGAHAVPVVVTARPRHDGTQRMFGPEYDELARAILNEATGAFPLVLVGAR